MIGSRSRSGSRRAPLAVMALLAGLLAGACSPGAEQPAKEQALTYQYVPFYQLDPQRVSDGEPVAGQDLLEGLVTPDAAGTGVQPATADSWTVSPDGTVYTGDAWPLPQDATSHPRSAGCFARFIRHWVRERQAISLLEGVRKCALIPAEILAAAEIPLADWSAKRGPDCLPPAPGLARRLLADAFGVASLEAFGTFSEAEACAAVLAIDYIRRTQAGNLPRLSRPVPQGQAGVLAMSL